METGLTIGRVLFHGVFTALFLAATFVFVKAVLYRLGLIFKGRQAMGTEDVRAFPKYGFRLNSFLENVVLQKKNFKEPLRGLMHAFVFYGFLVYTLHTTNQIIAGVLGWLLDDPYSFSIFGALGFEGLAHSYEVFVGYVSILVLIGLAFFAGRRWIFKAKGLDYHSPASAIVISMISTLMLSTLLAEGAKTVGVSYVSQEYGAGFLYALIGQFWNSLGIAGESADLTFKLMWRLARKP